jgi:hypothetical protein
MWQSLWANVEDEISRAQGHGGTGGFFGLPEIEVEDLTATASTDPRYRSGQSVPQTNGRFNMPPIVGALNTGHVPATNGSRI